MNAPLPSRLRSASLAILFAGCVLRAFSAPPAVPPHPQPLSGVFATPLTDELIDLPGSAEWVAGSEHPISAPVALKQLLWTRQTPTGDGHALVYGKSNTPGPRSLRIGFKAEIPVGTVLTRGDDQLSVLRSGSQYPGNLGDDSQWIPAVRASAGLTAAPATGSDDDYVLWVLPPGTRTRALRFTHISVVTDATYNGSFGGVYILPDRYSNAAPAAEVSTSANNSAAPLLVNMKNDQQWKTWDNGPTFAHPVSSATPEWITLTWPAPLQLSGLAALWAAFDSADTQVFTGPANSDPGTAPASQWQAIGPKYSLRSQYPRNLGIDWMDFGKTVTTRAVRLRMTSVTDETHPHLSGKTRNGTRVWLGEILALSPLRSAELKAAVAAPMAAAAHPPIPIHFSLAAPGYVTLVINDAKGNRVRNLVSSTLFPAGANTAWWDGSDDLGRTPGAADHGVYQIPTRLVTPGRYTARGIVHSAIDLRYKMTAYGAGSPPWDTQDGTGGWLSNHTPPSSALFVPADRAITGAKPMVYLGCYGSEGSHGLAWVDLDGHKQGGRTWVGGDWTSAPYLARDTGSGPDRSIYVAAVWGTQSNPDPHGTMQLRVTAITQRGDRAILNYSFPGGGPLPVVGQQSTAYEQLFARFIDQIAGLSVRNGLLAVSLAQRGQLALVDAVGGRLIGMLQVDDPRGSAFDAQGNLLVLSGKRLLRFRPPPGGVSPQMSPQQLGAPEVLIAGSLEDPVGITLDAASIYISDRGRSHQVKVFSLQGKFEHAIGHPGAPAPGPYDPLHMNNPRGMTIDSNQHLWVAEEDFQPKRVSVWTLDGKPVNSFYGPPEYGGGGSLDPTDKSKFYYHQMEFHLDWNTGKSIPTAVLFRSPDNGLKLPRFGNPSDVLYSNGHRYFTNSYTISETYGAQVGMLYLDEGGVLYPVAALGQADVWSALQAPNLRSVYPAGATPDPARPKTLFTWSDLNGNGQIDPEEVSFVSAPSGSVTIQPGKDGPEMLDAYVDGKAIRFAPARMLPNGTPVYDLNHGTVVTDAAQPAKSDGGGQMLTSGRATLLTTAPKPYPVDSIGGFDTAGHSWSYPTLWPGLHPSHNAPVPDHPGELIGTTHLLGGFLAAPAPGVGDLWAINGNMGDIYLFTEDGLFVTQLFQDTRTGKPWTMPVAAPNMLLNDVSLHDEDFLPSFAKANDGTFYISNVDLIEIDGLATIKRLPEIPIELTQADLNAAESSSQANEAARQQIIGEKTLRVAIHSGKPPSPHDLSTLFSTALWANVDTRLSSGGLYISKQTVDAAVAIAAGRLYASFRTGDPKLLINSGAMPNAPFKTGGALDLMIGTDPSANPARKDPVAGDLRLLVYQVNGQTRATLYRAVVKGTATPVPFSSPVRTITFDEVKDVSNDIQLEASDGTYSISVPLSTLGLNPRPGETIKADLGILRGDGRQTTQRVYWSNKATGITSDVPSEAALTPDLWGTWVFGSAP